MRDIISKAGILLILLVISLACSSSGISEATQTPYPTYTPYPTLTVLSVQEPQLPINNTVIATPSGDTEKFDIYINEMQKAYYPLQPDITDFFEHYDLLINDPYYFEDADYCNEVTVITDRISRKMDALWEVPSPPDELMEAHINLLKSMHFLEKGILYYQFAIETREIDDLYTSKDYIQLFMQYSELSIGIFEQYSQKNIFTY